LTPYPDFPELPSSDYEPTVVSLDVQQQVLDAIPEERRGLFLVLALLGVRPGEARALNVCDLKRTEDGLMLNIRAAMQGHAAGARRGPTKTRRWRSLPVPEALEEWLEAGCDRADLGAPLFPNPRTGLRWSHGAAHETWMKATEAIGIEIGFYEGTKHSRATGWLADGVDERIIQEALGHSDITSTHKYARLKKGALVELIGRKMRSTQSSV
jgi:integrase